MVLNYHERRYLVIAIAVSSFLLNLQLEYGQAIRKGFITNI